VVFGVVGDTYLCGACFVRSLCLLLCSQLCISRHGAVHCLLMKMGVQISAQDHAQSSCTLLLGMPQHATPAFTSSSYLNHTPVAPSAVGLRVFALQ
jgi:hypothetical protein